MKNVVILDYGMGNVDSVARALEECGADVSVSADKRAVESAGYLILPGVGAFVDGMRHLHQRGLVELLRDQVIEKRVPFLGICLGMQLLAQMGAEGGTATQGLGWIEGTVERLTPSVAAERIPHMGWNEVMPVQGSPLFAEIPAGKDFFFVHSYHLVCRDESSVAARTPYCGTFVSAIHKGNIWGVQFHPEKSQRAGFQLLRNFLSQSC